MRYIPLVEEFVRCGARSRWRLHRCILDIDHHPDFHRCPCGRWWDA